MMRRSGINNSGGESLRPVTFPFDFVVFSFEYFSKIFDVINDGDTEYRYVYY
jgi:hypothetical protein